MTVERAQTAQFFPDREALGRWLARHHTSARELWIGMYYKSSGKRTITYPEVLDEVLCVGWIDGLRKNLDADRYAIRLSPRKPDSIWSRVNTKRVAELIAAKRMKAPGLRVFEGRDPDRKLQYSFEQLDVKFDAALERQLRANKKAAAFFDAQPPGYRKKATFWIMHAKQDETRQRRLAMLIADSARGRRVHVVTGERRS